VFDPEVNEAVRILKRDKSADVRDPVAEISPFGQGASEIEVAEFVAKMKEQIQSIDDNDTETRASEVEQKQE
jgi:hypothetical protein